MMGALGHTVSAETSTEVITKGMSLTSWEGLKTKGQSCEQYVIKPQ